MASTSTSGNKKKIEGMAAFEEIAPSASTSGSKNIKKPSYDVFINHRGTDVKSTLASALYGILTGMALSVFLDSPELEYGDFLPRTIEAAMVSALVHIAIFSVRYAESPWCLAELSFMLKSGATIIPVFYHVEPCNLKQVAEGKGIYAKAFQNHEQKGKYSPEKLQEWKDALFQVSFYSGEIIRNVDDEIKLQKKIANRVSKVINYEPLAVAKHPVGLKDIIQDFEMNTLRSAGGDQDVRIVGIWGMGGSGKTTLARELYNKISLSMDKCSFISEVRDGASKDRLHKKQLQLLNDLGVKNVKFDDIEKGKEILASHLRSDRVLFVFDDVDHMDQLDALLPVYTSLGGGSLIIVTTREFDVLRSWGISFVHKMTPLDSSYGEQLFCWHAFLQSFPPDGFEELVEKFVKVCHGLPLSLKVFGGQLYGQSRKEYWNSLLDKISRILPKDIEFRLRVSYDTLDDEEKEMFLDTACFFIGEENSLAIEVWNGLGWSGLHSWETLQNKCLVELDNENRITMHDHLRDLARKIANQCSPSRLWLLQQIINACKQKEKGNAIRGIIADGTVFRRFHYHGEYGGISLLGPPLVGVKILVIRGDGWNQLIGETTELVWLRWFEIGQRNLPSQLSLKNLRVLELHENLLGSANHHLQELWEAENNAPMQLRELVISDCDKFQRFPNSIGCLKELKRIVIKGTNEILSLPEEFCRLQSLEHLQLFCTKLSSLPTGFGDLRNLRYLNLYGCCQLMLKSEDFKNIRQLEFLKISSCKQVEELPCRITDHATFTDVYLDNMGSLRELPMNIGQFRRLPKIVIRSKWSISLPKMLISLFGDLISLTDLTIQSCSKLESLPSSLGDLSSLTNLTIDNCLKLQSLPSSLNGLSSLTSLTIEDCPKLESLPSSLGNLSSLTNLTIKICSKLESLPSSLGDLSSLTHLFITHCRQLKCLLTVKRLVHLEHLTITQCPISQVDFGAGLSNLKEIKLSSTEVHKISISEGRFPRLERLQLSSNVHLMEIEPLPVNLQWLMIDECPGLDKLPSFTSFTSLRELQLDHCGRIEKIEGLEYCTRLKKLKIGSKWEMPAIESLKTMENLRRLELRANEGSSIVRCIQTIQKWPDEIMILTRAVPEAVSLVDSISNQIRTSSSNGDAILLWSVINYVDRYQPLYIVCDKSELDLIRIEKGEWVCIVFCSQRSKHELLTARDITIGYMSHLQGYYNYGDEGYHWPVKGEGVERIFVERGEEQRLAAAIRSLLLLTSTT